MANLYVAARAAKVSSLLPVRSRTPCRNDSWAAADKVVVRVHFAVRYA